MWRVTNQLHETVLTVDTERGAGAEAVVSTKDSSESGAKTKGGSRASSKSVIEDEEADFDGFDYNTERVKKASHVILSINSGAYDA